MGGPRRGGPSTSGCRGGSRVTSTKRPTSRAGWPVEGRRSARRAGRRRPRHRACAARRAACRDRSARPGSSSRAASGSPSWRQPVTPRGGTPHPGWIDPRLWRRSGTRGPQAPADQYPAAASDLTARRVDLVPAAIGSAVSRRLRVAGPFVGRTRSAHPDCAPLLVVSVIAASRCAPPVARARTRFV